MLWGHSRQERRDHLHWLQRRPPRAAQLRGSELLHPRGAEHPLRERYELCRSVHAEANAIISAARSEALGATLYMACVEPESGALIPGSTSCSMCRRLIINAGIARVVIRDTRTEYRVVDVADWVREDDSLPRSL